MNDTTKTKTKRNAMTVSQKFDLMSAVKTKYTEAGDTDTGFAKRATEQFGFDVAAATIKHYREGFGIAQIKQAPVAELKARIAELEAKLAQQPVETA